MEMIERYLQAVKFWLPKRQKEDIIAELSADIYAQVEEKEASLGRKLTEAEIEDLLKQRGRPVMVANRFLPQQYLIGPLLFPVYSFVMKIAFLCYLVPWVLVWLGLVTYSPTYRAEHTQPSWLAALGSVSGSLWTTAFIALGTVTVVFAVLERLQAKSQCLNEWSPRKLPPVRNPNLIPRASSSVELAVNLLFFGWLAVYLHSTVVSIIPTLRIYLNPQWLLFFWCYLLLALANAVLAAMKLMHPYWTVRQAASRLFTDCAGAVLFCWLLRVNIVAGIVIPDVSSAKSAEIAHAINYWMAAMFPVGVVIGFVVAATGIYRIVRIKSA
jgi:hypothetical protein